MGDYDQASKRLMASSTESVCNAVVALIESGEAQGKFARSIVTERKYDTSLQMEDTDTISVLVIPAGSTRTRISQATWNRDIAVDVVVRKRFASTSFNDAGLIETEDIDPYIELLEQIDDWLAKRDNAILPTFKQAVYIEDDTRLSESSIVRPLGIRYPYHPDHLRDFHQYTGIVRVAYAVESEDA